VLTAYSRVTVVSADRTIDLALPSSLPLSDVLPQLMHFAAPDGPDAQPATWTLARLGGPSLLLSQTLTDAGVLDGDVLELRPQHDDVRPATVEDVRDAVEDSVDASGGVWSKATSASFVVLVGSAALGLLGLGSLIASWRGVGSWLSGVDAPGTALAVVAVLLVTTWWSVRFARDGDAQCAAAVAMLWGAVSGEAVASSLGAGGWGRDAAAVLALAAVGGLALLLTPAATGHAAFGVVVAVAEIVVAVVGLASPQTRHDILQAIRVVPVLAVLAVGVLPRVSLSVGGLASADYRVRHVGRLDLATLRRRYRASNALLVGSLAGVALVVVRDGAALELHDVPWDRTLALSLAVTVALRSRLFSRTQHMVLLRLAGLVLVGLVLVRVATAQDELLPYLALIPALVLAGGLGLVTVPMSEITRARVKRTLNVVEFVAVVVLLVVACGAIGIYGALGGLIS
jgi:type VII secretion integral membrane protein EccD